MAIEPRIDELVRQTLANQMVRIFTLQAQLEALQAELAAVKAKLPIETAALHEAGRKKSA